MPPFLVADNLQVTYGQSLRALAGLSFSVERGEIVALVGPSGCGKSTLLRVVAGLVQPSGGQLTTGGLPPRAARQATRMSFVFQDPTLLPWRSVTGNVRLPLELAHAPADRSRQRVEQAVALVGLSEFGRNYPAQLSGGMRMRVSLARALVTDPEILLLDEPFAALDDLTRHQLNEDLLALWQDRRWTTLFVTHNIAEAVFLSQRVLVMARRPSRIVAEVTVPFEFPRSARLRSQADYARLTGEITAYLRGEQP